MTAAGCTGTGTGTERSAESPTVGPTAELAGSPYPDAVAVIGHSGATGVNSDPERPLQDVPKNSWATGANPEVDSVYSRVLALNPAADDGDTNLAVDGSSLPSLLRQARKLTELERAPDLVLVQTVDNDIACDGTDDENLASFADGLSEVLDVLEEGLPDADVVIVSHVSTVQNYAAVAVPQSPLEFAGDGPCDLVDPATGQLLPEHVAGFQAIIDAYQAEVDTVCAAHANCRTDEGAASRMVMTEEDLAFDLVHLSVAGHHKLAESVWAALYPPSP